LTVASDVDAASAEALPFRSVLRFAVDVRADAALAADVLLVLDLLSDLLAFDVLAVSALAGAAEARPPRFAPARPPEPPDTLPLLAIMPFPTSNSPY